jgi:hypothetical protein
VAGVEDAPNVNGRSAGFESFSASFVAADEAAPNAGVVVAAPKLNVPLADLGASALASAKGAAPKVNGFGSSLALLSSSFDVDAPKVKGFGAEDCSPLVASSVVVAPPNEKAGADADRVDFWSTFGSSAVLISGFCTPKVNGVALAAFPEVSGPEAPKENGAAESGFDDSGALEPPNVKAGTGCGALTGTLSGDFGGAPNVNVGALAGRSAVFAALEEAPRNASNPESPPAGFEPSASAGFAGAVEPKENVGAAPVAAGAVDPKEKPALPAPCAGSLVFTGVLLGMPNENAGLGSSSVLLAGAGIPKEKGLGFVSPLDAADTNGDGAGGLSAAFSSSSIASCTFFWCS